MLKSLHFLKQLPSIPRILSSINGKPTLLKTNKTSDNELSAHFKNFFRIGSIFGISATAGALISAIFYYRTSNNSASSTSTIEQISSSQSLAKTELELQLVNHEPAYIETPNLESLISLPRYQAALISIRICNQKDTRENRQRVFDELAKLSECDEASRDLTSSSISSSISGSGVKYHHSSNEAIKRIEELIKVKLLQKMPSASERAKKNGFLNDGLANYVSQCLREDLMVELAIRVPGIDTRFFRTEPPTTINKLNKQSFKPISYPISIYDDPDYSLLFEFNSAFIQKLNRKTNKDKDLLSLVDRFSTELNSLIVSEYFLNQASVNIWSQSGTSDYLSEDDEDEVVEPQIKMSRGEKVSNLKEKIKQDFIYRNEILLLSILDKMIKLDLAEFVRLGGFEILLLVFEKHKHEEYYLNIIGNCLCLMSVKPEYSRLFVHSGWLKRLSQMLVEKQHNQLCNELIAHKILFNLYQNIERNKAVEAKVPNKALNYSTMLYPLWPMYSSAIQQVSHLIHAGNVESKHNHIIDVVFVHGLRGSVFKTWRQDDPKKNNGDANNATTGSKSTTNEENKSSAPIGIDVSDLDEETNLINALSNLIAKYLNIYTHCWPKDWLPLDLIEKIKFKDDPELELENESGLYDTFNIDVHKYRLIGVNYDTLYSLWGEELVDDKKLKLSIKQRAIDLFEQLKPACIGVDRPVIWVCHSMGGLIVKQMLVDSPTLLSNTRGIVFMSTPHLGSNIAKTASKFAFLKPSTEVIELSTNSKYLVELNQKFLAKLGLNEAAKNKMTVLNFLEKQPTHLGFNFYWETVPEMSANLGVGEFCLVENYNHLNICKPKSRESVVYDKVKDLINDLIESETLGCERCRDEYKAEKSLRLSEIFYDFFKLNYFY